MESKYDNNDNDITNLSRVSILNYAGEVLDRMFPNYVDGLKPVLRRIVYQMHSDNNYSFTKSGRIVGQIIGKLHPHGDQSVYQALVGLALPFKINYPYIERQGSFGSLTGDPAAAMRYTEAKLSKFARDVLLDDLSEYTVEFKESEMMHAGEIINEPEYLPAKLPIVLLNGSQGVGVGFISSIPMHNLTDIINRTIKYIRNKNITNDELVEDLYPDFPTGGIITNGKEIIDFYKDSGERDTMSLKLKSTITIKDGKIVVTDLPFNTDFMKVKESIIKHINNNHIVLSNIEEIHDEIRGMNVLIEIKYKKGSNPLDIIKYLYKLTPLSSSFNICMRINKDGVPKSVTVKGIIKLWYDKRVQILKRKFVYEIAKDQNKQHVLEGLFKSYDKIDAIIKIIREGKRDREYVMEQLEKQFNFSKIQADKICDMPLISLSSLSKDKLYKQIEDLKDRIISNKKNLDYIDDIIVSELIDIDSKYGRERRTQIIDEDAGNNLENTVSSGVVLSSNDNSIIIYSPDKLIRDKSITNSVRKRKVKNAIKIYDVFDKLFLVYKDHVEVVKINDIQTTNTWLTVGDNLITAIPSCEEYSEICFITENGFFRKVAISEIMDSKKFNTPLTKTAFPIRKYDDRVVIISDRNNGKIMHVDDVPLLSRSSKGSTIGFKLPYNELFCTGMRKEDELVLLLRKDNIGYYYSNINKDDFLVKRTNKEKCFMGLKGFETTGVAAVTHDKDSNVVLISEVTSKELNPVMLFRNNKVPKKTQQGIALYQN